MKKLALPLLLTLFLAACGHHHLSGTYTGQDGGTYAGMTLDFTSDSVVQVNAGGAVTAGTYTLQGQQVTLNDGGNTMVLTIDSDGCLDGGDAVGKFCKQ
jgi:hypothetical protein